MPSDIQIVREQRNELWEELNAIRDKLKGGDPFTEKDEKRWDSATAEYDDLSKKIERLAKLDQITAEGLAEDPLNEKMRKSAGARAEAVKAAVNDPFGDRRHHAERWMDRSTGREIRTWGKDSGPMVDFVLKADGDPNKIAEVSLGQYLRSIVPGLGGPQTAAEKRALSEGTDTAGGFTVPDILLARIIDALRAQSRVIAAGAEIVQLQSDSTTIVRVTDGTAAWRSEAGAVAESDMSFAAVTLTPQSLAILTKASVEVIEDSVNIERALQQSFAGGLAAELDRVALFGTGSAPEPRGIRNTTDVNEVSMGTNGAPFAADYAEMQDLIQLILEDNAEMPDTLIMAPREFIAIDKFTDTTTQPIRRPPSLEGKSFQPTSNVTILETQGTSNAASTLYMGGFRNMIIGMRHNLRILVLKERYADNLQIGFIAHLRADIALAQPKAFGRLIGITT